MMKKLIASMICAAFASVALAGEYPDISVAELEKAIEAGTVLVIDVNGAERYNKEHIPGAISFRGTETEKLVAMLEAADKDLTVVAYCGGPSCSAYKAGAKAAEEAGFTSIKHLSAGISGWIQAGKDTASAESSDSDS